MDEALIERTMRRALTLATNGPADGVNPQVGCVILSADGRVLAEGWHRGAGTPHAEVDALSQLTHGQARGATVVVTLEPCNHTGRTGPCAVALIEAGVAHVVYAAADPGHHSSGGAERLRAAGIEVTPGVLGSEARALLADWLEVARLGRPVVTVKWASSLDGRAAAEDGSSQWITGAVARADVHERRAAADAIVVGTGTVLADNPSLTARNADGTLLAHQPIPVVVGQRDIPATAAVCAHPHAPLFYRSHDLAEVLADLRERGIRSVFVEGGPTLASAFVAAGLVDHFLIYLAPTLLGGSRLALGSIGVGSIADQLTLCIDSVDRLGNDLLVSAHPSGQARTDSTVPIDSTVPMTTADPVDSTVATDSTGSTDRRN